jgi:hypothetical protein
MADDIDIKDRDIEDRDNKDAESGRPVQLDPEGGKTGQPDPDTQGEGAGVEHGEEPVPPRRQNR